MITKADIIKYLEHPELSDNINSADIYKLINIYPYFELLHWLYLRILYVQNDATFDDELLKHGMHISNRRVFYDFMTYSGEQNNFNADPELLNITPINYFDIEKNPDQQQSLKDLAKKLKEARLKKQKLKAEASDLTRINNADENKEAVVMDKPANQSAPESIKDIDKDEKIQVEEVQNLIKEKKYSEAIEILRSINLNNPKKSVYFALQIKYLETIINNNNKID